MPGILFYDTTEAGRQAIQNVLGIRSEWELVGAATSEAAITQLNERPIDLVVIDIAALEGPSDRLLEWLRSHCPQVPIILLTPGNNGAPANVEALLLGAASYVPRSVIARDLVVTVERILTLAGCRRHDARLLDALQATETKFTLENNDLKMVPVLVRHLADVCDEFRICSNGNRLRTAVALEEAMTNGIIHGNLEVPSTLRDEDDGRFHRLIRERRTQPPYCTRTLNVRGMFNDSKAQFSIRDDGPGFDPSQIPDPTDVDNLDKPHGRGLFLIRAFMDDVSFNEQGNEIRLVKCSSPKRMSMPGSKT